MRVLVCDDSAVMRKAISQIVASDPSLEVIDTAKNGREAVEKAVALKPDLITLDIEMPEVDGLTALTRIMAQAPTRVLMVSSLTTEGSRAALKALRLGALDVVAKDQSQITLHVETLREQILAKIRSLREARPVRPAPIASSVSAEIPKYRPGTFDAVLIGSSTGGPPALEQTLTALPADLSCPVVIAQHMPEMFTKSMAERLDQQCAITVVHGENRMPLHRGTAYIVPGGKHGRVHRAGPGRLELEISAEPREALYKPSVNELFASGARTLRNRGLAVIMTGMGDDGFIGGKELAAAGGTILAQSADTCVVYGMPKGLTAHGLAEASLSPRDIGRALAGLGLGAGRPAASENPPAPSRTRGTAA
ncbi:MAG: protein-glutamate methylesterase/protein-glutamine glutaminase [Phycisphaerales bacterium]